MQNFLIIQALLKRGYELASSVDFWNDKPNKHFIQATLHPKDFELANPFPYLRDRYKFKLVGSNILIWAYNV